MSVKSFVVFLTSLIIFASSQIVFSQTNGNIPEFYQTPELKTDYKQVDVVVYVNVKERKLTESLGEADCENDKGTGYCMYILTAEVKEVFKGRIKTNTLEFHVGPDAGYPKKYLMGEKLVFLERSVNSVSKKTTLWTLENSTRSIDYDVIEKMRKIAKKKVK